MSRAKIRSLWSKDEIEIYEIKTHTLFIADKRCEQKTDCYVNRLRTPKSLIQRKVTRDVTNAQHPSNPEKRWWNEQKSKPMSEMNKLSSYNKQRSS